MIAHGDLADELHHLPGKPAGVVKGLRFEFR
jgi:hypothetical protein